MVAALLLTAPLTVAPSYAADEYDCASMSDETLRGTTEKGSVPLQHLNVDQAHALFEARGIQPGAGVKVAVVDSGVADTPYLDDIQRLPSQVPDAAELDFHGTAVAGLIASNAGPSGPIGIAPGATIVDVRVYDSDDATAAGSGLTGLRPDNVVDGLQSVLAAVRGGEDIGVVNVSLAMADSRPLRTVIRELVREDVVVVAASGNRPKEEDQFGFGDFAVGVPSDREAGEDAATYFFPAGYEQVLTVNATGAGWSSGDVREYVLQNSMTDVAAPTYNAVTLDRAGGTCRLVEPPLATSWAAAEISGVVAMLRSWYPDETARQIIARITTTANGVQADAEPPSRLVGAGMVQPYEAMTRPLEVSRTGTVAAAAEEPSRLAPARAPQPEVAPFGSMRDDAVWWGLLCGAVIVLALLMRPIIVRLRRT
jgi:membrane-anchored mycosin MYCP